MTATALAKGLSYYCCLQVLSPAGAPGLARRLNLQHYLLGPFLGKSISARKRVGPAPVTQIALTTSSAATTGVAAEPASPPGGVRCCSKSAGEYIIYIAVGCAGKMALIAAHLNAGIIPVVTV